MSEEQAYKKYFREVYLRAEKGERAKNRDERGSLKSNWKPEDLIDKAILVVGENGLGDEVLTIACLSDLENKCKSVSWKCDQKLKKVFSRSFPNVRFLSKKISNLFPDGTVYSWELIGRFRKTLGDFPRNEDAGSFCPYLKPSVPLRDCLSARYNDGAKKVVGLAWRSERDGHILSDKTCDLRDVAHWFAFFDMLRDKVRFVSLQYGATDFEIAFARWKYGVEIYQDKGVEIFDNINEAAAQIAAMDYVVSISTTAAHLAGALGTPGCVLLQTKSFGHWRAGDEKCPWYPNLTPIRQSNQGDWENVLTAAAEKVLEQINLGE